MMRSSLVTRFALVALFAAACTPTTIIIDGQVVERPTLEFTGDAYAVQLRRAHPRPRGPSSGVTGPGGDLSGNVCGMSLDFDVTHRGDHVQLVGSLDGNLGSSLRVQDHDQVREITGNLGTLGVDLKLTSTDLKGSVGLRVLAVEAQEDDLVGFIRHPGIVNTRDGGPSAVPLLLRGRNALWSLPPAAQAVILASNLTCYWAVRDTRVTGSLELRFGGEIGRRPRESSSLYRGGY